jgi:RHS repeat-associated protein
VTVGDGTSVTRFAYDGKNAWADLDGNNNNALQTRHLYLDGLDQPVARISAAGVVAWYLTDHLGSVRDEVNDNGVVLNHIDYTAFGAVNNETNPAKGDRFGWAGGIRDGETGLNFFDHRYYNPQTGEWTTKDPSGFRAGDANLYRYVGNSPTNARDPSGLFNEHRAYIGATTGVLFGAGMGALVVTFICPGPATVAGGVIGGIIGGVAGGLAGWFYAGNYADSDYHAAVEGANLGALIPAAALFLWDFAVPAVVTTWTWLTTHPEAAEEDFEVLADHLQPPALSEVANTSLIPGEQSAASAAIQSHSMRACANSRFLHIMRYEDSTL